LIGLHHGTPIPRSPLHQIYIDHAGHVGKVGNPQIIAPVVLNHTVTNHHGQVAIGDVGTQTIPVLLNHWSAYHVAHSGDPNASRTLSQIGVPSLSILVANVHDGHDPLISF
jgi:hypothetical protein